MAGCDTITLKRFKIPFGAVEMTQKLKAHTVLSEVLVLVLCTHTRQLTLSVSPGNLPVSSSPPDITCNVVPMYVHTQTQNTKIFHSSPFCLPPSLPPLLPSLYLFPSLSPFEKLVYFFAYSNMDNKVSMRAVGIPAEAVGVPWINSGQKGRDNGTWTKSGDPSTDVSLWKSQTDNIFSQRAALFEKQTYGKKHKRGLVVRRIKQEL